MIFLDYSLFCSEEMTPSFTATNVEPVTTVALEHGTYDHLYATRNITDDVTIAAVPEAWDDKHGFDTYLYASFDNGVAAGNVTFILDTVDGALLMRREMDTFKWVVLDKFTIETPEDFNVIFQDRTTKIGVEYEYAFTPIINGVLGNYNKTSATSKSNRLVVIDSEEIWTTYITDGFLDTTRTYPGTPLQTLYNKFPTVVRNTVSNFDTITVSGTWLPTNSVDGCEYMDVNDPDNFPYITSYAKKFIDFLTNNKPKIIKAADARAWLVWINDGITDNADQVFMDRKITFSATEIGDANSNDDLYNAGFLPEYIQEWI